MQNSHGDVYSNGAIYTSLPSKKELGVNIYIYIYPLVSNPKIRGCLDFCQNQLAQSWEAYADTGC